MPVTHHPLSPSRIAKPQPTAHPISAAAARSLQPSSHPSRFYPPANTPRTHARTHEEITTRPVFSFLSRRRRINRRSFSTSVLPSLFSDGIALNRRETPKPTTRDSHSPRWTPLQKTAAIALAAGCAAALTTPRSDGSIWMRHTAVCNLNHNDFDFDDGVATIDLDSPPTPWPVPDQLGTLSSLHAAPCRRSTPAGGMRSDDVFKAAAFAGVANALSPAPVSLQYSDWLGNDGNWSTVQFLMGSNADLVSVLVSTSLSEFWAIGPGGCLNKETHCMSARGGIYSPKDSKQWSSWGRWELGLSYLGYGGNGLYGLDTINAYSPITDIAFGMGNVLTAAINTTDYFLGLYGLGITQGRFGNNVGESSLAQAVKDFGWIPSYSYGFTAGAYYKNMPVSATLGGYDTERFVAHDSDFTISQEDNLPRPNVRGIQVTSTNAPSHWNSSTQIISDYGNFFSAVIDSSTPFLWLPPTVCDNIASAFNLTYNETFQLYTLTNDQYQSYSTSDDHTFTLSLSSIDNHDNFGLPLSVPGVVNITLPIKAFVGTLQYPFQRETIKYGQPAIPYFMLRKSDNETNTILGRSFLQESYLITKFDSGTFSIHQAKFPDNPDKDVNLVGIKQPSNSPFPPPPRTEEKTGLTTAQMVGIAVGVVAFCTVLVAALCCYRRRRNQRKRREAALKEEEVRDSGSTITPDSPKTPVARILSKIARRKRSRRATGASTSVGANPTEVPDSEIYELPAPPAPVELAAGGHDDTDSIMGDTEMGTDSTQNLSAYEIAKRKLDRQLAGPVPAYAPPADGIMPSGEKEEHFEVTTQPAHSFHNISPVRSHEGLGTNSLPGTLPSPVSPRTDGHTNELPSPIDGTLQQYSSRSSKGSNKRRRKDSVSSPSSSSQSGPSSRSNSNHSNRSNGNAAPAAGVSFPLPQATFQRTPIEPSKVVCLGPLPDNVQLFRQKVASQAAASNEGGASQAQFNAVSHPSEGSLGSNYTDDEDRIVEEMTRQSMRSMNQTYKSHQSRKAPTIRPVLASQGEGGSTAKSTHSSSSRTRKSARSGSNGSGSSSSQRRPGRIDGDELIHVPQMAEKRYSWEEGE